MHSIDHSLGEANNTRRQQPLPILDAEVTQRLTPIVMQQQSAGDIYPIHPLKESQCGYIVKFKRIVKLFILGQNIQTLISVGDYVKVEADRGEDLGVVHNIISWNTFESSAELKRITCIATVEEIRLLKAKHKEEVDLLNVCRHKVQQRGLHMKVIDAEYQFDRNKLTFFFEAAERIDFRGNYAKISFGSLHFNVYYYPFLTGN